MAHKFKNKLSTGCSILRSAWLRPRPFLLYFKPTARCNLSCKICNRGERTASSADELDLDEIKEMLTRFRRAGAVILTLWGGEPTLRRDLPQILAEAQGIGFRTAMCTNGYLLSRRAAQVLPHLDTLLVSLDGIGDTHDRARGTAGLFDRVIEGIEAARAFEATQIKIWASVHQGNRHEVAPLASLARDLGVGIEFFPISAIPGYNDEIVCGEQELFELFGQVIALKQQGYPIKNPASALELLRDNRSFRCNFSRIAVQVDHTGALHSCEDPSGAPLHPHGHFRDTTPEALYSSSSFRRAVEELSRCNRCRLPCVVELSGNLGLALAGMFWRAG